MRTIIPPDINLPFMGVRKKAFIFSGALAVISLFLLVTKGFDLGIDFRGGSSAIAAFEVGKADDHGKVRESVKAFITTELKRVDSEVSVQGFGSGSADELDGKPVDRLLIYTEVTSMVDATKRDQIVAALKAEFGADTRVSTSDESGDTMYLTFAAEADITERRAALQRVLAGVGYSHVTITSDFERGLEVEFLRDVELERQDKERDTGAAEAEATDVAGLTMAELDKRKAEAVVGKADKRFTVDIEAFQAALEQHLAREFKESFVKVESAATVSPSVGSDLFNDGMLAMLYSFIGILIYVTLRFDFRYAPGALVGLAHDTLITMGFIAAVDIKFSLPVVASILTIIGYSINDKIIVFDRVRETAQGQAGREFETLINKAVNQTLSRTIFTSGTTLFSCIALMVFGGAAIFDFGLILFFGVTLGTYSSIFVAAPFIYYLDNIYRKREGDKGDAGPRKNRITRDDSTSDKKNKKPAEATI
ncbi:MAG: protein translocase subunit SecF [Deltaproteobacteria bacterium]|nr:protein translocase subunit SecF [Deltaproteobacteria bacterium]